MGFFNKDERFELHLDHGRLVMVAIGVLLVGALLFLLGMLVGRSLLATSTDPTARIDAATAQRLVVTPPKVEEVQKKGKKPEYTFYENVDMPEGQGAETLPPKKTAVTTPIAGNKSNTTLIVPRQVSKPATDKPIEPVKPVSEPRLIAPVPPAPKATAVNEEAEAAPKPAAKNVEQSTELKTAPLNLATVFTVQVGSFKKRAMAEKMAAQIKGKGAHSTVREVKIKGDIWYRVQVGEFATKNEARAYYDKKLKPKKIKGFILTR